MFADLIDLKVLPRSRYEPWVRVGEDYEGSIAMAHQGPLVSALESALPSRFLRELGDWYHDSATSWAFSLLEGSIAAATRAGEPYESQSNSVGACIEGFTVALTRAPVTRVALVVSDLDLSSARSGTQVLAGVTLVGAGNSAESVLERVLPGSGYLVDRLDAFAHPGETAVAWSDGRGWGSGERSGDSPKRRIGRLLTAVRLITGTTAHGLVMAYGSPDPVAPYSPTVTRLPHSGSFRMVYRGAVLGTAVDQALERLLRGDLGRVLDLDAQESDLAFALARFNRAATDYSLRLLDRIVELSIALEAALGGPDRSDVSLRLRVRAAALLASPDDPEEAIYDAVKILYDLRSRVVHGDPTVVRELTRSVGRVPTRIQSRWEGEQLQLVYDRFSDIVRRAIAARIALGATRGPWPWSGRPPDVDRLLSATSSRALLKRRVTRYWFTRQLGGAVQPAPSAAGLLGRS